MYLLRMVRWSDDTSIQTQHSEFEPWRSDAEHATQKIRDLQPMLD